MTDAQTDIAALELSDPTTAPFWAACREHRFVIQRCGACGHHQFYPRPICLVCESKNVGWVDASGRGTIYSLTVVRVPVTPELLPPYFLAIVDLDEGPRMLTNIVGTNPRIGDRVTLDWRARDALPSLPIFVAS